MHFRGDTRSRRHHDKDGCRPARAGCPRQPLLPSLYAPTSTRCIAQTRQVLAATGMSHAYPPRAGQRAQPSPLRADPDSLSADRHSPPPSVAQTHSDTAQTLGGESRPTKYLAGEKARPGSEERAKSEPSTTSDRDRKRVGQEGTAGDAPTQAQSQPPYTIYSETMRWSIVGLVSLAGLFS